MQQLIKKIIHRLRLAAGKFVLQERNFTGANGCIHVASSFIAWNQVEGDYLEFGVYKGASFSVAFHAINRNRHAVKETVQASEELSQWLAIQPRFFAFDSFEGLPPGEAERHSDYAPGSYACSEADFLANIEADGVDRDRVVTVRGMYDQSLTPEVKTKHSLRRAALVMIDCDLYESTVPVLNFITDLVGQGSIIIFHDWFRYKGNPNHGEQRACREWLQRNPHIELIEYWREGPQAVSFLVNLRI